MILKEKTKLFKALSEPSRLRILKMLDVKSLCVCEITDILQLATSTVSKHLSILKDAGFIIEEKDGKWVNYLLNLKPSDKRVKAILSDLSFWVSDIEVIKKDLIKIKNVDRQLVCRN